MATSTTSPASASSASGSGSPELLALAGRVIEQATADEQIEVSVGRTRSTSVKAYEGAVESFTSAETFGVGVRVIVDGREGFAHAGTFDEQVIFETLAEARDNASFAEPDEFAGIASPDGVAPVDQTLWRDEVVDYPVESKVDLAIALEKAVRTGDPRVTGVRTATYGDAAGEFALASTAGIGVSGRGTTCHMSVSALAADGDETHTGFGVDVGRDPAGLDLDRVAADAIDRATRLLGATQVPSQRIRLLLEPDMSATLLGLIGGTLSGSTVLKGRSPFAERLGEQIASPLLTLVDDPTNPDSMGADIFDGEGLACRRNVLIEGGELRGFLHNSYTGRRSKTASTGSAVRGARSQPGVGLQALTQLPGERGWDELVAGVDEGFLVQSMNGLHSGVNTISGDFSVGATGMMIRGGELAEPVREVTIASTLQRMLLDIEAVSADIEWLPSGAGCAGMLVGDVSLSGS